jgi:hypothetical protein
MLKLILPLIACYCNPTQNKIAISFFKKIYYPFSIFSIKLKKLGEDEGIAKETLHE